MNYKPLIREKLNDFIKEHPEYTFGQIMYSVATAITNKSINIRSDFLTISDEDFYTGIDKALRKEEKEENGEQE